MKRRILCNRIDSSILALILVLSVCVSPLVSLTVHAEDTGLAIKAVSDVPEAMEGKSR